MVKKRATKINIGGDSKQEKTIRKTVPISIIKITDVYKSKLQNRVKDKHKNSITDKVIFQIIHRNLQDIPDKDFFDKIPKKYLKKKTKKR